MAFLNFAKLVGMTGSLLIFPGIIITGPIVIFVVVAGQTEARKRLPWRTHKMLVAPLVPVILIWVWAAIYARVNQQERLVPWKSQGLLALAALAIVISGALLGWYRRDWRKATPLLALASWIAIVACFAGLWAVQGWPAL